MNETSSYGFRMIRTSSEHTERERNKGDGREDDIDDVSMVEGSSYKQHRERLRWFLGFPKQGRTRERWGQMRRERKRKKKRTPSQQILSNEGACSRERNVDLLFSRGGRHMCVKMPGQISGFCLTADWGVRTPEKWNEGEKMIHEENQVTDSITILFLGAVERRYMCAWYTYEHACTHIRMSLSICLHIYSFGCILWCTYTRIVRGCFFVSRWIAWISFSLCLWLYIGRFIFPL